MTHRPNVGKGGSAKSRVPAIDGRPTVGFRCMQGDLAVTGNGDADALLNTDPLALLIGTDGHCAIEKHAAAVRP